MKIKIISVGKLKEEYLREAVEYYSSAIRKYCLLEVIEVADERAPENYGEVEIQRVKEREGERILSHMDDLSYVIALDIMGKVYTTKNLVSSFKKVSQRGYHEIIFIIGGSNGLSPLLLKRANERISFSPMTFPHQLMRVILLEQMERCLKILNGEGKA